MEDINLAEKMRNEVEREFEESNIKEDDLSKELIVLKEKLEEINNKRKKWVEDCNYECENCDFNNSLSNLEIRIEELDIKQNEAILKCIDINYQGKKLQIFTERLLSIKETEEHYYKTVQFIDVLLPKTISVLISIYWIILICLPYTN